MAAHDDDESHVRHPAFVVAGFKCDEEDRQWTRLPSKRGPEVEGSKGASG